MPPKPVTEPRSTERQSKKQLGEESTLQPDHFDHDAANLEKSVKIFHSILYGGILMGHLEGVAVAVANRLVPMVIEVTPVNERIMGLRISHTLGVISMVSLYANLSVC